MTDESFTSSPSWSTSARTNLRLVRRELARRRLRLGDLPPLPRRIGRAALTVTILAAFILAAFPLIETGRGPLPWTNSDLQPAGITYVGLALLFGGTAIAFGLAAFAAPIRYRRLVAAGLAVAGFVILPTDINGGLGGGYDWPLASWAVFVGLSAVLLLVAAALIGLPRSRHLIATIAAVPPLATIATVLLLQPVRLPNDVVGDELFVQRLALSEAIQGAGTLAGLFSILAIWAVIEYSKGLGASSSGVLALRPRWWWAVPALAALKLVWVVAASARVLPEQITPNNLATDVIGAESPLSLVLAAAFVTAVGVAAARRWLAPRNAELTTGIFWLLVIPIVAAFVFPTVAIGILAAVYRFGLRLHTPPPEELMAFQTEFSEWYQRAVTTIGNIHPILIDAAPLIAALTAITVAIYAWTRHPRTAAGSPFLAAYGAWTVVPAISLIAVRYGVPIWDRPPQPPDNIPSLLGNVNPMTLDVGITILALILGLVALRGRVGPIAPPLLLALLFASTVIAYGDQFTPAPLVTLLFWIGLAFPVLAQYGLDAVSLNKAAPDRSARVLFALAITLLAISASYAALLNRVVSPGDTSTAAMVRQLALMPLVLMFVLAYASQRAARDEQRATSSKGAPAPNAGPVAPTTV